MTDNGGGGGGGVGGGGGGGGGSGGGGGGGSLSELDGVAEAHPEFLVQKAIINAAGLNLCYDTNIRF